jgi:arsenate reductase
MSDVPSPRRVLFICTHNSARSQMAEGMLRTWGGGRYEAYSAGTEATLVRPLAIVVMDELGIDLRAQTSKTLGRYLDQPFDRVITVCDDAREACPVFPGARGMEHWSLEDPSAATGTEAERLAVFRAVRDEIARRVRALIAADGALVPAGEASRPGEAERSGSA